MKTTNDLSQILLFSVVFLFFITLIIVVFVIKSRKRIFDGELEKKNLQIEFQNQILQKTILTQEEERKRIAQDLHDDIGSKLIAVSLNLHLLQSQKTPESAKKEILENISAINNKAVETSRKIEHNLFPPVLEKFGLKAALEELTSDYNKTKSVEIKLNSKLSLNELSNTNQLQIFRIIQELINNSIKHGKSSQIDIDFEDDKSVNTCIYKDNGFGFNSKNLEKTKGLGFSNIENRIANIKGKYAIVSEIGKGFQINFTFTNV